MTITPPADADAEKRQVALVSMFASGGLAIAKLVAGLLTGSLGLLSEAVHSLLDLGATAITYWAVIVSGKPADRRHRYGHAKMESIAALIETGLLFAAAAWVATEAVRRLLGHPSEVVVTWWAIAIVLASIVIDWSRAQALHRVAKATASAALEADALHFTSDMVSSIAVLAGLALVAAGLAWADAAAALLVSGFIVLAAFRLGRRTIDTLTDAAPEGAIEAIERIAGATEGVLWLDRVRARPAGPTLFVDAAIAVPRTMPFDRVNDVKRQLEEAIRREFPESDLSIAARPVELDNETVFEKVMLIASRRGLAVHHVTVQSLAGHQSVSLDLEVDGQMPLAEAHEVADGLERAVRAELGPDVEVESHIEPMLTGPLDGADLSDERRAEVAAVLGRLAARDGRLAEIHDVRVRQTPLGLFVTIHCSADPQASVQEVHDAVETLEQLFQAEEPGLRRLIAHAEPRD